MATVKFRPASRPSISSTQKPASWCLVGYDPSSPNSYFIGSDGRGTITINTGDATLATAAALHALPALRLLRPPFQFPGAHFPDGFRKCGYRHLGHRNHGLADQHRSSLGGYAFAVSGLQLAKTFPVASAASSTSIRPTQSRETAAWLMRSSPRMSPQPLWGFPGHSPVPITFGAVTLNLTAALHRNKPIPLQLTGYIVDNAHIKLIETDNAAGSAAPFGSTVGLAIGQGTATGTFTGNTSFSGTYVFGVTGVDLGTSQYTTNSGTIPLTSTSAGLHRRWQRRPDQWIHRHFLAAKLCPENLYQGSGNAAGRPASARHSPAPIPSTPPEPVAPL